MTAYALASITTKTYFSTTHEAFTKIDTFFGHIKARIKKLKSYSKY
jgi:hypothetical protein